VTNLVQKKVPHQYIRLVYFNLLASHAYRFSLSGAQFTSYSPKLYSVMERH